MQFLFYKIVNNSLIMFLVLYEDLNAKRNSSVSCGRHRATRCSECPYENGAPWCNGDCVFAPANLTCTDIGKQFLPM